MSAKLVLLLVPLVIVEVALMAVALRDLAKRPKEQVAGGKKWVWGAVILFGELVGPIVYLLAGRKEG